MTRDELKQAISEKFADRLVLLETGKVEPFYELKVSDLLDVARTLRDDLDLSFDYLCNLGGNDTGEQFDVHYNLTSITRNHRIDLKVVLDRENPAVPSVQSIWPAANWFEREMWELYGFTVENHDNLTRFLLPESWDQGHPMRKDWDAPDFVRLPDATA
jgi:NADH-quinone oxidoreductase subunit C